MSGWMLLTPRDHAESEWFNYYLGLDNQLVAFAQWKKHGNNAELHNEVLRPTKSVLVKCRENFHEVIRPDMRAHGVDNVVVIDLDKAPDQKRIRYWKFMGFDFTCVRQGYTCAVMEA